MPASSQSTTEDRQLARAESSDGFEIGERPTLLRVLLYECVQGATDGCREWPKLQYRDEPR